MGLFLVVESDYKTPRIWILGRTEFYADGPQRVESTDRWGGSIEYKAFQTLWNDSIEENEDQKTYVKMNCPVLTRWYLVGNATRHLLKEWDNWEVMGKQIRNGYTSIAAPNKCASSLLSLMREPVLKAHAGFVHGYHISYWNEQYVFFTAIDKLTKTPGFRSHHMPVRTFVMDMQLKEL